MGALGLLGFAFYGACFLLHVCLGKKIRKSVGVKTISPGAWLDRYKAKPGADTRITQKLYKTPGILANWRTYCV